jgi:hypothetical protein
MCEIVPPFTAIRFSTTTGDSREPNVAAIKGFFGSEVTNLNRLADVDIMVADPDRPVTLPIEVEERSCSPKKVLGDAVAIMMCNRFVVRLNGNQHNFEVSPTTQLVVSGILPDCGNRVKKVENVIAPRFRELRPFNGGIDPRNIDFVFMPSIDRTVDELKAIVRQVLPS